jgi:hexosaminidase
MAILRVLAILGCVSTVLGDLVGVPTVPFTTDDIGSLSVHQVDRIVVDPSYANTTDVNGWTLIPPTLFDFAGTFQDDLGKFAGKNISLVTTNSTVSKSSKAIYLTISNCSDFVDAAGRWTSEAYQLEVTGDFIFITGASPSGVWWGTRTVLQQAVLGNGTLATGSGVDAPGWNTRGIFVSIVCDETV